MARNGTYEQHQHLHHVSPVKQQRPLDIPNESHSIAFGTTAGATNTLKHKQYEQQSKNYDLHSIHCSARLEQQSPTSCGILNRFL